MALAPTEEQLAAFVDEVIDRTRLLPTTGIRKAWLPTGTPATVLSPLRARYRGSWKSLDWGYQFDEPYKAIREARFDAVPASYRRVTHRDAVRPTEPYSASKVWGEGLCRAYADGHGIRPRAAAGSALWCSQRDIATAAELAVNALPELHFDIFLRRIRQPLSVAGHRTHPLRTRIPARGPRRGPAVAPAAPPAHVEQLFATTTDDSSFSITRKVDPPGFWIDLDVQKSATAWNLAGIAAVAMLDIDAEDSTPSNDLTKLRVESGMISSPRKEKVSLV